MMPLPRFAGATHSVECWGKSDAAGAAGVMLYGRTCMKSRGFCDETAD
jgi:lipoate synthase